MFINDNFISGHSRGPISSTFGNPPLTTEEFDIDYVEVFTVQKAEKDERFVDSALQKNPEVLEMLEMTGRTIWSKALQDPHTDEKE